MKYSPKGHERATLKALMNLKNSEEQGNPNGSKKERGKDLLRRRKQRKGVVELSCEQVDAAANGEARGGVRR